MMSKISQRKMYDDVSRPKPTPSLSLSIPLRRSSYIFKRPVTRITSHPGNETRCQHWEETTDKPQQACWQKRLQGLQAHGSTGEMLSPLEMVKNFQELTPGCTGELTQGILAGGLHSSPLSVPTQPSDLAEGPPEAGLQIPVLLCRQCLVTEEDIREQERRVQVARERLAIALIADTLASQAEKMREQAGVQRQRHDKADELEQDASWKSQSVQNSFSV